jgi:hypothetical protein
LGGGHKRELKFQMEVKVGKFPFRFATDLQQSVVADFHSLQFASIGAIEESNGV